VSVSLTDITSLLSSLTAPSGAITASADLLSSILKIAEPLISDDQTHKYDQAATDRINELVSILAQQDGDARADKLNRYFSQLCVDAGTPAVGLGDDLSVPVAFVVALAAAAARAVRDNAILTDLTVNAAKQLPEATK
jgi:hypothetical protein